MRTPDLTLAQWLALVTWCASQAVAFGALSSLPTQGVLSGVATALTLGWILADALIRHGRAKVAAAAVTANPGAVTAALLQTPVAAPRPTVPQPAPEPDDLPPTPPPAPSP